MLDRSLLKFYAEYFYDLGLNVSFTSNKSSKYNFLYDPKRLKAPFYEWKSFETERQPHNTLINYNWEDCFGIGIILGYNNVAAIDIDGCVNEKIVKFILNYLQLPPTYEWVVKSGSQAGYHIIFKTKKPDSSYKRTKTVKLGSYQPLDEAFGRGEVNAYYPINNFNNKELCNGLIDNNSFCKIEFKWKGHVIIPPSVHNSGRLYSFLFNQPRSEPEDVDFEKLSELQILISGKFAQDSSKHGKIARPDEEEKSIDSSYAIVIDCETNGLPIDFNKDFRSIDNWPRLLQVSWLVCGRNHPSGDFAHFHDETLNLIRRETRNIVPKNFQIEPNSQLIHGLSIEFLTEVGEQLKDVLKALIDDIKNCNLIIGHNLSYDLNVIMSELLRCGMDESILIEKEHFCTMKKSVDVCKIGNVPYKFPSLTELFFHCFKEKISIEHNSIFDAFLTMKCFDEIGEIQGKERFNEYLANIHP